MIMKVLYVSDHLCETNGAGALSRAHLCVLQEIVGIDNVFIISLTGYRGKALGYADNNEVRITPYKNRINKLLNLLSLNYVDINDSAIKTALTLIDNNQIDFAFVDESYFGKLVWFISKKKGIPVASFYHDVKAVLFKEWIKKERKRRILEFRIGIFNEKLTAKYSTYNIVLNQREAKAFQISYGYSPSFDIPVVLREPSRLGHSHKRNGKIVLGFIGAYYYPNVNGIKWFCKNVMPLICKFANLRIAGKGMEVLEKDDDITAEGVFVDGTVERLDEFYNSVDVIVSPVFEGAGMKVKTAEAFSYGKPFLGTKESLIGYKENLTPDLSLYIRECNTVDEFYSCIKEFERSLHVSSVDSVYDFYKEHYSYDAASKKMREIIFN